MVYEWKLKGLFKTDPNIAGQVMSNLERNQGLNADTLLEASRPKNAPLHNEFEWDDGIAAERYRRTQASLLIRHICIVREDDDAEPVRAFFTTDSGTDKHFSSIEVILNDVDRSGALLERALKEANWFKAKYEKLEELADLFTAITKITEKHGR